MYTGKHYIHMIEQLWNEIKYGGIILSQKINEYQKYMKRFNKVIIWGLKSSDHSHAYIQSHFYETLQKLGTEAIWVDDLLENQALVQENDLIIVANVANQNLPLLNKVYYCFHNCDHEMRQKIEQRYKLTLQVYTNTMEKNSEQWGQATFFNHNSKTLYQPWATELLPDEFKNPVEEERINHVYWVGSIWNNELNQGNENEIRTLKKVLIKYNIEFNHMSRVSNSENCSLVRTSKIAPAIAGRWQVENDYLPCRMWKNISYGQLGISNVKKFNDIFRDCSVPGETIEELVDYALTIPYAQYKKLILEQQEIVKDHTYLDRLLAIAKAYDFVQT
jgi:hypothetical protein